MFNIIKRLVLIVFILSNFGPNLISFSGEIASQYQGGLEATRESEESEVSMIEESAILNTPEPTLGEKSGEEKNAQETLVSEGGTGDIEAISEDGLQTTPSSQEDEHGVVQASESGEIKSEDGDLSQQNSQEQNSEAESGADQTPVESEVDQEAGLVPETTPELSPGEQGAGEQNSTSSEDIPLPETPVESQSEIGTSDTTEKVPNTERPFFRLREQTLPGAETLSGEEEVLEEQQDPEPIIGSSYKMLWEVGNPVYGDGGLTIDFTIWAGGPVTIHWGDGTQEALPTASDQIVSHTYTVPGSYTVQIAGDLKRFRTNANNNNARHAPKLHKVLDWGGIQWSQNNGMFRMAKNLTEVPVDAPNLSHDISTMFWGAEKFNQNINHWNTSNVTNMAHMFRNAKNFNQPLDNWDTSKLEHIFFTFAGAEKFNQDISNWNTEQVTSMEGVFNGAKAFNQPLTNWNTSKVTNMAGMFANASAFNQPLDHFDTSKVTNMGGMFRNASIFNQDISNWNVEKVKDMNRMFRNTTLFNQPLTNWTTSSLTNMHGMFWQAEKFNQPLDHFDTSKVTDMERVFRGARAFNQDISNWNTEQVTNMREMFYEALVFNKPIGGWNTSKVTKMDYMFYRALAFDQSLENWDTSEVTQMHRIFNGATAFNQPLTNWNTSKVTNMEFMFASASSFNQPLAHFDTSRVTSMQGMFRDATVFNQPLTNWITSELTTMEQMFQGARKFNQPLAHFDTSKVTNMQSLFVVAKDFDQDLSSWNTSKVTNMNSLFAYSNFSQDISSWDISAVTSMENILRTSKVYPGDKYDTLLTQRKSKLNPVVTTLGRVNSCYRTAGAVRATFFPSGAPDDRGECPNWDQQGPVFSTGLVKSFDPDLGELYFAFTGATDNDEVSHYLLTLQQCDLSGLNCTTISQDTVGALLEEGDAQLTHQASIAAKRYIFTVVAVDISNNQSQPLTAEQDVYTAQINFATDEGGSLIGSTNAVIFSGVKWSTVQLPSVQENQGYQFDRWEPELPAGDVSIVSDATFTAKFIEVEDQRITINFTSDNVHGSISSVAPQKVLKTTKFGSLNKPNIIANPGYIATWSPSKPDDSTDFTAIGESTITYTINFVEKSDEWITVNFSSDNQNGTVTNIPAQKVLKTTTFGALSKPNITANAGYEASWSPSKPDDSTDFTAINESEVTYTINFVEKSDEWITVNFSSDNQNGNVSIVAPQKVLKTTTFGALSKPNITANAGYEATWSPSKPDDSTDFTTIGESTITYTINFVSTLLTTEYRVSYFTGDAVTPFIVHTGVVSVPDMVLKFDDIPNFMPAGYSFDALRSTPFPVQITSIGQEIVVRYVSSTTPPSGGGSSSGGGSTSNDSSSGSFGGGGGYLLDRERFVAPIEQKPLPNLTELESAYRWAYQHGITTLAPFEDARLDEAITRAELSKMLSVYAIKFMQRAVNFDKLSCKEYRDLGTQNESLKYYPQLSCMLGIMGLHSDGYTPLEYFMPTRSVSRAEFATTISRLLYGANYDNHSSDQWWINHLAKLYEEKIITVLDPELIEQRAYILLVLWRLSQGKN